MNVKQITVMAAAVFVTTALMTGCAGRPEVVTVQSTPAPAQSARQAAIEQATPIRTEPAARPAWVDSVPDSPSTLSLVGSAGRFATATGNTGARYYAEENGRT